METPAQGVPVQEVSHWRRCVARTGAGVLLGAGLVVGLAPSAEAETHASEVQTVQTVDVSIPGQIADGVNGLKQIFLKDQIGDGMKATLETLGLLGAIGAAGVLIGDGFMSGGKPEVTTKLADLVGAGAVAYTAYEHWFADSALSKTGLIIGGAFLCVAGAAKGGRTKQTHDV